MNDVATARPSIPGSEVRLVQVRKPITQGLLPTGFLAELRAELEEGLSAAYSSVQRTTAGNHRLWQGLRQDEFRELRLHYEGLGLEAPPLAWDALWARVDLPVPSNDGVHHSRLVVALATDYGERFCQHIEYRLAHHGNVHAACRGPTGSGKSSCMIALLHWIKPIPLGKLCDRLAFDTNDLPRKLANLEAGDGVLLDELVATVGEGARTNRLLLDNLEDTLRASQRNLFVASPGKREHSAMQVDLECIAWHVQRRFSLFLCWVEGIPMGVVALPWCSAEQYAEYAPWKGENVQRTLAGQFHDKSQLPKLAERLFADSNFVDYLMIGANKPTVKTFRKGVAYFCDGMMPKSQSDRLAELMLDLSYDFERLEPFLKPWFGIEANDGLRKVAAKCYAEA